MKKALWVSIPSSLKPRTLKRQSNPAKPARKRIPPVSKLGRERMTAYRSLARVWLSGRLCDGCWQIGKHYPYPASEVHHKFGRAGKRLLDVTGFVALCSTCHRYVHDNPAKARAFGLLAPAGKWNKP